MWTPSSERGLAGTFYDSTYFCPSGALRRGLPVPEQNLDNSKARHAAVTALARELNVRPLIAALLIARGHDTKDKAIEFLNPSPEHLHEPFLLKGMREAVDRIQQAIKNKEKILIWGDYDVDGTTGTVLLRKALHMLGGRRAFTCRIGLRGLRPSTIPALEKDQKDGYSLVISVDCGIRSFQPLEWAMANGLDVIVQDHPCPTRSAASLRPSRS